MGRTLYWHLTAQEVNDTSYPAEKLLHWEIRCGFSEESYFSVYWFRTGTPYDKEPINGIAFYGVECSGEVMNALEDFLKNNLGGSIIKRGYRTFLSGAKVEIDNKFLADLALQITRKFGAGGEIWLEFEGLSEEEEQTLFPSKSLSITK
jgi:hypothetical protein